MKLAVGSDHAGYELKNKLKAHLLEKGYEVIDCGTDSDESVDYPKFGVAVGETVKERKADLGIIICGTGIGVSIAANKVKGIRAALCTDCYMAKMARQHNNANILALGARVIGSGLAQEITDAFLETSFAGWEHARRVDQIKEYEENMKEA